MKVGLAIAARPETLEAALEGLVLVNCECLRRSPLPPLYRSGVRYKREPSSAREAWQTCEQTYARGSGDCEDLATWRAAELRQAGDAATCVVRRTGPRLWHVLVMRENGAIEDPSRVLGMGST